MKKHRILLLFGGIAVIASGVALAQQKGYYEQLRYRKNDPFVFCTQGASIEHNEIQSPKCWVPLPPYTGAWTPTYLCRPENYYGARNWQQADYDSLNQYMSVCPQARTSGSWTSRNGQGAAENTDSKGYNSH